MRGLGCHGIVFMLGEDLHLNRSLLAFNFICTQLYTTNVLTVIVQAFYERCRLIYLPKDFHISWQRPTTSALQSFVPHLYVVFAMLDSRLMITDDTI